MDKYNIIFLDIDGVLNGYNFWSYLGWEIACLTHNKHIKEWYRKISDPSGIHKSKVKRLNKIVKATGAKIVLSSTWRFGLWAKPYNELKPSGKKLIDLFHKYNIEIIDITPRCPRSRRDDEIIFWLSRNEHKVKNFIILDDERSDLECFVGSNLIQTSSVAKGNIIKGHWKENTGLRRKHVKQAIKKLQAKEFKNEA